MKYYISASEDWGLEIKFFIVEPIDNLINNTTLIELQMSGYGPSEDYPYFTFLSFMRTKDEVIEVLKANNFLLAQPSKAKSTIDILIQVYSEYLNEIYVNKLIAEFQYFVGNTIFVMEPIDHEAIFYISCEHKIKGSSLIELVSENNEINISSFSIIHFGGEKISKSSFPSNLQNLQRVMNINYTGLYKIYDLLVEFKNFLINLNEVISKSS